MELEEARYPCLCCGYPMLGEQGGCEICELCDWEDDVQSDSDADKVRGGPNQDYSLTEGRRNFKKYLIMYDPARPKARQNSPAADVAKRTLMQLFDKLPEATDESARQESSAKSMKPRPLFML